MSKPAVISGSLVDAKNIAVHKTLRLSIDVPVESAQAVLAAFGWPTMASPVPVAVARLVPDTGLKQQLKASVEHEKQKRSWSELSRAQQAGIACNEQAFQRYLNEEHGYRCSTPEEAAEAVREICGTPLGRPLVSRSQLDLHVLAGAAWDELHASFKAWMAVVPA